MKRNRMYAWTTAATLTLAWQSQAAVFINELHYDDSTSSGDTGEAIEVVATAGESLSGYRIYLYNGTNTPSAATVYDDDALPAGSLVSCGGASVRIATLTYPSNGIQNGAKDGIALVDGNGSLVQFLSYEGQITGGSGPASGQASTNLPVSETNSTAPGTSLQLSGSGSAYADFTWQASSTASFGACNSGQSFSGGGTSNTPPSVVSTTPQNGETAFPAAGDLGVGFSEMVTLASGALSLQCQQAGSVALTYGSSGQSFDVSTATALPGGDSCTFTVQAAKVSDSGGAHPAADTTVAFTVASSGGLSGYYSHVNTSSPSQLRCSLHQTIRGHTAYPYSGSGTNSWTILEIADEDPGNSGKILDAYRNRSYTKVTDRAGSGSGLKYNREHTWPNSLGFSSSTGNLGLPYAPYTDIHMLYLTDSAYNANRGNKPYADCPASAGCTELATESNNGGGGGSGTYPGNSNWYKGPDGNSGSFEVWGARKGDVARAVMYMAIRYEGDADPNTGQGEPDLELTNDRSKIVITTSSPAYMGLLSTLLEWNAQDPPDDAERERNEVVYSFQGNRNPFVDHPEWATEALFTSSKPQTCQLN